MLFAIIVVSQELTCLVSRINFVFYDYCMISVFDNDVQSSSFIFCYLTDETFYNILIDFIRLNVIRLFLYDKLQELAEKSISHAMIAIGIKQFCQKRRMQAYFFRP